MNENHRDDRDAGQQRRASSGHDESGTERDELAKRREQQRQDHLTRHEREERWPIG